MRRSAVLPLLMMMAVLFCGAPASAAKQPAKKAAQKPARAEALNVELAPGARAGMQRRNEKAKTKARKVAARNRRAEAAARRASGDTDNDLARFDKPDEAVKWYLEKRLPKGEKQLPVERYYSAMKKIKKMKRFSTAKGKLLPAQDEASEADLGAPGEGEAEIPGVPVGGSTGASASSGGVLGTWQSLGPGNIGGRTRALLINPSNPDVMYAAAVAGGIWKTTDAGASWVALDDFLPNIAVTAMAFDPSNPNTIYAGTGEGFFNADGVRGAGVFKTTDAGATWTRLASTVNSNFFFVNDLVVSNVNPQNVYAATRAGVFRSPDGGATWTLTLASNAANGLNGAMDLVIRTDKATDYLFAAVGTFAQARLHRNTDAAGAGAWEQVYTEAVMGRTSLALAPSNQDIIYALSTSLEAGAYSNGMLGVFRSDNSGDPGSWTARVRNTSPTKLNTLLLSNPVFAYAECVGAASVQMVNQGWYDNVIAVDPVNPNVVWAGGTDIFRSDDGGANWGVASYWWFTGNGVYPNANDPQYAHADIHALVFHPQYDGASNRKLFVGNDGGIFRTDNTAANTSTTVAAVCGAVFAPGQTTTVANPVTWTALNNGYAVTQFYHGVPYPDGKTYFGGTQDNGTNRGTDAAGANAWSRINGGDGGYVAVNPANTNFLYLETTGLSIRRSTNGGASSSAITSGISGDAFPFITTFIMDPTNPARMWIGGRHMWRTNTATAPTAAGVTWTRTTNATLTGGSITAMAVAPTNPNRVIAGAASGVIRFTTVGTTATPTTAWSGQIFTPRGNGNGTISWLAFDPTNEMNVYATVSTFNGTANVNGTNAGHVFKSTNGGATWTNIDGAGANALPDIPAHTVVVDPNNTQRLYVGTDLGVFVTLDGGQNWARETTGFSNVVVESLSVLNNGGVTSLFAFTHGRGAFKVVIPASCANVTPAAQAFFSPGAAGTVSVTKAASATAACDWNAVSNSDFITVDSAASGAGDGTVSFTVAPNAGAARTGTLTVAGQVVTVTQDAAPVASDDAASTDEDTPVNVNVRANDTDSDNDPLAVTALTQPAHGVASVNPDGTVRYAPAQDFFGADSFTYTVSDGHATATANVNVTVNPVNDAPVISVSPAAQTVQYADPVAPVTVSVTDVDDAAASLTLSVVSALPAGLAATPGAPGTLVISGNPVVGAGGYPVQLKAVDPQNAEAGATATFTVAKENAAAFYTGDTSVVTAGPSITQATFRLGARLVQEADGAAGDITLARVTFELFKSNNMTDVPDRVVAGVPVDAAGDALTIISGVAADTYLVKVRVDAANGFWTANPVAVETVNVAVGTDDQRANGGGWVADASSANGKSNFGFTVSGRKGTPKGNFVFVTRGLDGFTYVVKSNTWQGGFLNFAGEPGTPALTRSSFKGRANVQKIDPATGLTVQSWGNYGFTVDVRDGDLLDPREADAVAISIQDGGGATWRQLGAPASLLTLGGGNVHVKGQ